MGSLFTFTRKALWRSWRYVVEFGDHWALALPVCLLVLGSAGLSIVFVAVAQSPMIPPIIGLGVLVVVWLGAFGEWDEANKKLKAFTIGAPLEIDAADIDERGGQVFARLIVRNINDAPIPDCYVKVEKCNAQTDIPEYRGPPKDFHFNWSTYTATTNPQGTLAPISRKSTGILDVAYSQMDAAKCRFGVLNTLTQKLEPHFTVLKGEHQLTVEVGSKSEGIEPARYTFVLSFQGGLDLKIEAIQQLDP